MRLLLNGALEHGAFRRQTHLTRGPDRIAFGDEGGKRWIGHVTCVSTASILTNRDGDAPCRSK